ncbi:hypothetical protein DM2_2175 [Halorubrum sp. DM2]|nr:hypothetical protein DM2_2175 [Halorubrum sp. DM2]
MCVVAAASYAIAPVRGVVTVERALVVAGVAGLAVFALASRDPDRFD